MNDAQREALVTENMGLAHFIARKFFGNVWGVPSQDIESAAGLGLTLAARDYEPARGNKFSTFAWKMIRGTILSEIRRLTHGGRALHTLTEMDADGAEDLADPANPTLRINAQIDARKQIERLTLRLSQRSKRIIYMRFVDELSIGAIAKRFGITEGRVSQIVAESLETMRKPVAACHIGIRQRVTRAAYDARRRAEKRAA